MPKAMETKAKFTKFCLIDDGCSFASWTLPRKETCNRYLSLTHVLSIVIKGAHTVFGLKNKCHKTQKA